MMPSTMRNLLITLSILLTTTFPLAAQDHSAHHHDAGAELTPLTHDQLLQRFQELTGHPMKATVPMPDVMPDSTGIAGDSAKTFAIVAKSFQFDITPSTFVVNQGDVVTLNISVPSNDPTPVGHGVLMEQYVTNGITVQRGHSASVTFTANVPGSFEFICTQPSCGTGHNSMVGTFTVTAGPP